MMAGRAVAAIRSAFADRQPVLVFLAGPNGAGKSTFFSNFLEPHLVGRLPFVNADEIGKALREAVVAGSGIDYDRLAFDETEELRRSFLEQGLSFCTETVFSDPGGAKLDFLRRARKAGYAVLLVFVGLDDARTLVNLRAALEIVSAAFLFDNSSDLQPFRPVAIYADGKLLERFDPIPPWASGLPEL
jgi:hypothetical protein